MRMGDRVRDISTPGKGKGTVAAVVAATYVWPTQYTVKVTWDNKEEMSTLEYSDSLVLISVED